MATKNLKVLMSGDTKPYRQEVDQAAVATKQMKDDIGGQLDSLAGIFGTSMGTIGQSAEKISTVFVGLTAAFQKAASGGEAFVAAKTQLISASNALSQAEARSVVANQALAVAQADATISAEALAAAELEVSMSAKAMATAQGTLAIAQKAVAVATDLSSAAMEVFKLALISTGIGALVVALGSLVAFLTQTQEGANKVKVIMAEVGAASRVLIDYLSTLGKALWDMGDKIAHAIGASNGLISVFKNIITVASPVIALLRFTGVLDEMTAVGEAAGDLEKRTQALNKEERENIVIQQQRMTLAAQLRNDAKQEGVSNEDKKKMLTQAKQQIIDYYAEEKKIAEGRRDIAIQEAALHKDMGEELTHVEELKAKVLQIDQESAEAQKALAREMKGVNTALAAEAKAAIEKAAAQKVIKDAMAIDAKNTADAKAKIQTELTNASKLGYDQEKVKYELEQELSKIELQSVENQTQWAKALKGTTEEIKKQAAEIEAKNKAARASDVKDAKSTGMDTLMTPKSSPALSMTLDTKGLAAFDSAAANARAKITALRTQGKKDTLDLSNTLKESMTSMGADIGTFIGNLAMGQGSITGFADMVAGAFANLAITVGKQMIAFGVAGISLKKLIKDPWTAVAAGVALVALGTIANDVISNSLSSGGTGSISSNGSTYDTTSNTAAVKAAQTKITVTVNGKLTADGKGLATALTNENTRISLST